jgi:rhodanese-related sulfurtransferase
MRVTIPAIAAFLILSGCARGESSAGAPTQGDAQGGTAVAPQAGQAAASESVSAPVYLDVRTAEEYAAGHVAGTVHIPLDQLEERWQELAPYRDRDMVVYCRSGRRSAAAIDLLASRGFSRLQNGGGLQQMAARGLPVEPTGCC